MGAEEDYLCHSQAVYRLCLRYLRRPEDAEDAMQTTFVRWLRQSPDASWTQERKRAWLLHAAANVCRDELRRQKNRSRWSAEELEQAAGAAQGTPGEAVRALCLLPEPYRTPLYLHDWLGYTAGEIGRMLGRNPATVRTQLCRGRRRLRKLLEG